MTDLPSEHCARAARRRTKRNPDRFNHVALDVTEHAKPPRAVFVPFMMGHHFGTPFHRELQRQIITEALTHLVEAKRSGEVRKLPVTWAEARRQGVEIERQLGLRI